MLSLSDITLDYPLTAYVNDSSTGIQYHVIINGDDSGYSDDSFGFEIVISNKTASIKNTDTNIFSWDENFNITVLMDDVEVEWITN